MPDERLSLPEREKQILEYWEKNKIFQKSLEKPAPMGDFVFYEGPPTANGRPGIHHVEARAFKDLIPRYKTMRGFHVDRKGGWDTHGLPVELEVEKQLGFTGKAQIEEFGIREFNAKCKESVWTYLTEWQEFTKRIGYWVDIDNAYVTYKPEYVESLWGVIKKIWDRGLLYQDYRVTPHCPRCGTSLSSHELSQGYQDVKDISVYAKFRVTGSEGRRVEENEFFVAWTTTPWTLPSNVALAVGEKIRYVKVKVAEEFLWCAKDRLSVVAPEAEIVEEVDGSALVGMEYEPLYPYVRDAIKGTEQDKKAWYVAAADFVTTTDGSGIVHTAVMYGADDFELGNKIGLSKYHLVKLDGTFLPNADFLAGRLVTDEAVTIDIIKDLAHRGLLFKKEKYEHSYPHCWRCKSKVIYYAKDSWYIRMSSLRDKLLEENEKISWEPAHIQQGRFGEWLREVKDWAFSRERYWGTPLPIWVCQECGEKTCVGSFAELGVGKDFDPHRPYVDEVFVKCAKCGGSSRRVKDVCDVWFDSGAMPYASGEFARNHYPADYICEAIDQTRGWFYTLLAVSTALGLERPFKNVICLGHVQDAKGKKMSKSLGNIVKPMEMIEAYGADSVRWYMYTINQPGESKRFDEKTLVEMQRSVFGILGNVAAFYETYASGEPRTLGETSGVERGGTNVLDKWIVARTHQTIREVTDGLDAFRVTEPARLVAVLIDDLSTWWLRRSRDRFKADDESDKSAALATLRESLMTIAKLLAPFAPFFAEDLYLRLSGDKESIHLEAWPTLDAAAIDEDALAKMQQLRTIVSKLLEARSNAGKNVRQVLAAAIVTIPSGELGEEYLALIRDEVNVKKVIVETGGTECSLDLTMTPELVREGTVREIVRRVNAMRKNAGLTIEDRIELFVESFESEVATALGEHRDALVTGVLGTSLRTTGDRPANAETFRANEFEMTVGFERI